MRRVGQGMALAVAAKAARAIAGVLQRFGDAESVSARLRQELAFGIKRDANGRVIDPWFAYPMAPSVADALKRLRETSGAEGTTALFGGGIDAYPAMGLFRNAVRLAIRGCEEYQAAIAEVEQAIDSRSVAPIRLASSHWEGCVEAICRATKMVLELENRLPTWVPDDSNFRIAPESICTRAELKALTDMRNAMQHMDERILSFVPNPAETDRRNGIFVYPDVEAIKFRKEEIEYRLLAAVLNKLSRLCHWLHMKEIPAGHPLAAPGRTSSVTITDAEPFRVPFTG